MTQMLDLASKIEAVILEDLYLIGDFSSLFEISFGLSIILYYIDLRSTIKEKIEILKETRKRTFDILLESIQLKEEFIARWDNPSSEVDISEKFAGLKESCYKSVETSHNSTEIMFAALSIISAVVSLGSLMHAGIFSTFRVNLICIIALLAMSYSSAIMTTAFMVKHRKLDRSDLELDDRVKEMVDRLKSPLTKNPEQSP